MGKENGEEDSKNGRPIEARVVSEVLIEAQE